MSVMMIVMSLGQTAAPIIAVTKAASAASDFFAIIDAPLPPTSGLKETEISANNEIVFESVTFAYPSRPHVKILDNLNIRFEAGKVTAIVGASGSGKSTITGLIERWYGLKTPESIKMPTKTEKSTEKETIQEETKPAVELGGSISISGHNLDELDLKWWRSQM